MKYALRNIFLITLLALGDVTSLKAQYSVNYDYQTIAAMVSGYATQAGTEVLHQNNVSKIEMHIHIARLLLQEYMPRSCLTEMR